MTDDRSTAPPSTWLRLLESRALFELGAAATTAPVLRRLARGDGHAVLVLPGFLTDDRATSSLRYVLRGQGYRVHGWQLGRNLGPTADVVGGLRDRLVDIADRSGGPVSLVGMSLGGLYARRMAQRFPELVRQVVSLGSPFRMTPEHRSTVSGVAERMRGQYVPVDRSRPNLEGERLAVPTTSIYTRTDGVVRYWHCLESPGSRRENIEVRGSHSGLAFNPAAIYAVGDRLAQPVGEWRPFEPPAPARQFFPRPDYWRPSAA